MTINCKGQLVDLDSPKVMGIVNITPNSFYDGGKYLNERAILQRVGQMLADGATFIDVGAYSSKPNAEFVSEAEENQRILPIVKTIVREFPNALLSIDTFRSTVAESCIGEGAAIINDISAGSLDGNMMNTIAKLQVPYIMMHMRGTPQTMNSLTNYSDIVQEILFYFSEKIALARSLGINDLLIDPGFGFAKTIDQNYEVFQKLELFDIGLPLLIGISRKSMIYKKLSCEIEDSLNGTSILNTLALMKGAKILRVHDVKEAIQCVKLIGLSCG